MSKRTQLIDMLREQEILKMKNWNIFRIDREGQTTENAYIEKVSDNEWTDVDEYEPLVILKKEGLPNENEDWGNYYNHGPITSLEKETNKEFNRRQYRILQSLKRKNRRVD